MPDQNLPVTYTVEQLAKILHSTEETIRRHIKSKKIPAIRVGGKYLVTEETLQKILSGEIKTGD
jgi:excisionase family DNA binding protein